MTCETNHPEVHVNDIGTLYRVRIFDDDVPFDPTTAMITRLIFLMPGSITLTKAASVMTEGSPADTWFISYQVGAADGAGSPPDEFHALPGSIKIQVYLAWADGSQFYSDIRSTDEHGRELRIYPNLS